MFSLLYTHALSSSQDLITCICTPYIRFISHALCFLSLSLSLSLFPPPLPCWSHYIRCLKFPSLGGVMSCWWLLVLTSELPFLVMLPPYQCLCVVSSSPSSILAICLLSFLCISRSLLMLVAWSSHWWLTCLSSPSSISICIEVKTSRERSQKVWYKLVMTIIWMIKTWPWTYFKKWPPNKVALLNCAVASVKHEMELSVLRHNCNNDIPSWSETTKYFIADNTKILVGH